MRRAASALDYRDLARRRLPLFLFDHINDGSPGGMTSSRNSADLAELVLRTRVLTDVSRLDLSVDLFGGTLALPVILAPVGLAGLMARRGEVQAAQAAERAGVPFCLSLTSVCPIEEVARATSRPFWFQLSVMRDRGLMADLLARARAAGCSALVVTVDRPVPAPCSDQAGLAGRSAWRGPSRRVLQALRRPGWAYHVGVRGRPHRLGNVVPAPGGRTGIRDSMAWLRERVDPAATWRDLAFVRDHWSGSVIVKGILDREDAMAAATIGADGIVVSNHGGRQLDGAPSTAAALPEIADAVRDRLAVLVDGGIRSGLDVVRMLALGAHGVLIGRAWAYALAARGGAGVYHLLQLMEAEMRMAVALTGRTSIAEITPDVLVRPPGRGASAAPTPSAIRPAD